MNRYVVTLEASEREELLRITSKGSHRSQKVINALILLNCDEGECNEHRSRGESIAQISERNGTSRKKTPSNRGGASVG